MEMSELFTAVGIFYLLCGWADHINRVKFIYIIHRSYMAVGENVCKGGVD